MVTMKNMVFWVVMPRSSEGEGWALLNNFAIQSKRACSPDFVLGINRLKENTVNINTCVKNIVVMKVTSQIFT